MNDDQMDALRYSPQLWQKKRRWTDYLPALGFALGAAAAWYWRLSPFLIAFCLVACVGWFYVCREERK